MRWQCIPAWAVTRCTGSKKHTGKAELGTPEANSAPFNLQTQEQSFPRSAKYRGLFPQWLVLLADPEILGRDCLIYGAVHAISQIFPSVHSSYL